MGAWSNFVKWLNSDSTDEYLLEQGTITAGNDPEVVLDLKLLCMASAVGYLASGLAMCRWRVIENGEEKRNEEYFRLNNRPNPNQSKTEFCAKLLYYLSWKNEAVIFSPNGRDLYVADSYTVERNGVNEDTYQDVTVDKADRCWTYKAGDVMHLKMNWVGLWPLLSNVADEYEAMIKTAYSGYKKQTGTKGVLNIGAVGSGTEEQQKKVMERVQQRFKVFYDSTSAVIPLNKGYEYTPIASTNRNTSEINDVVSLTDEFNERLALALRVPVSLLKGNAENTEHARTDLVMYGIRPIAQMIEQEYNAKRLGAKKFVKGSRLFIDPLPIQLSNMETLANFCERMISCGQYSVDELRELRGEPLLGTPAAQEHYITKNYGALGEDANGQGNTGSEGNPADPAAPLKGGEKGT